MTSTPNPALVQSTNLALTALQEVTDVETIGKHVGIEAHSDTTATLLFDCLMPGYPGWRWAASLAQVTPEDPVTVLEVELLPGDDSLVAPEWVPWAERLAAYRETQAQQSEEEALAAEAAAEFDDEDDDEDDVMDNDYSDFDSDIDGVDIDSVDFDSEDDDTEDEQTPDEEE